MSHEELLAIIAKAKAQLDFPISSKSLATDLARALIHLYEDGWGEGGG